MRRQPNRNTQHQQGTMDFTGMDTFEKEPKQAANVNPPPPGTKIELVLVFVVVN